MNTTRTRNLLAAALVGALACTAAQAQQVPMPKTAAEVPGPASGNAMTTAYVQTVGQMAYIWGWPLVKMANRAAQARAMRAGSQPGVVGLPENP